VRRRRDARDAWPKEATDRFRAGKRLWSRRDDAQLRARYPHEPTAAVARDLRRSLTAVYARARLLGVAKTPAYLASPEACRLRRGDHVGRRFRFPPGHVPANKGLRRPGWSAGRMRETQFKPGERHGVAARRYMPVGSTRLVDGYLYRKVSDVMGVPWTVNWKIEHRLIWERAHGPIPPGHALVFRNGDRTDVRLANLACISRRALMARNSVHTLPPALAQTVLLLGALNRRLRRKDTHGSKQDSGPAGPPL